MHRCVFFDISTKLKMPQNLCPTEIFIAKKRGGNRQLRMFCKKELNHFFKSSRNDLTRAIAPFCRRSLFCLREYSTRQMYTPSSSRLFLYVPSQPLFISVVMKTSCPQRLYTRSAKF